MNKKNKQLVPICIALALLLFLIIVLIIVKPKYEEFSEMKIRATKNNYERQTLEDKIKKIDAEKAVENLKLKSLKPIYETNLDSSTENLGVFGNMFEEIIKKAQKNGLLIRSIEYDMRPANDPIYMENSEFYNACELKFFFVGSYSQLQAFMSDMNNNFNYLTYISQLKITAFSSNTDYLLINISITLYSKKNDNQGQKRH